MSTAAILSDELLGEEELSALALAGDPDAPLPPEAVPFLPVGREEDSTLPAWYMPPAVGRAGRRGRLLVGLLVLVLLAIEISGLCTVFGQLVVG